MNRTIIGVAAACAAAVACGALIMTPVADAAPAPRVVSGAVPAPAGSGSAAAGKSTVPTVDEWNAVTTEVTVNGSSALGCETKALREWFRISCRGNDATRGKPTTVKVTNAQGKEVLPWQQGDITSLVFRFEPGTKVEATFNWQRLSKKFVSEWPSGAPKPSAYGRFF